MSVGIAILSFCFAFALLIIVSVRVGVFLADFMNLDIAFELGLVLFFGIPLAIAGTAKALCVL